MRAEVDDRFFDPQDIDPIKECAREELAARACLSLPPRFWQVLDIPDRDVGWDVVGSLVGLGRRLFLVEASHGLSSREASRSRR